MQDRAGTRLRLERIDRRLERSPHLMQQFNHFAGTEDQLMDQLRR